MLKKIWQHKLQFVLVMVMILLLALVRAYEDTLFYDPLLQYFKIDYNALPLPSLNQQLLFLNLLFRFALNTVLSLVIIYLLFRNRELTKFAAILYVVFFVVLIITFFTVINYFDDCKSLIFYVRRFLIQPIFLLLFIPAFYFQEIVAKKNNIS